MLHRILQRQAKKFIGGVENIPQKWNPFFDAISKTYLDFDNDHALLDRSLELSSKEFFENNRLLREAKEGVEKIVQERTKELEYEKKRVEEANVIIKEKNKYLEVAINAKNDFIRIANHQLNTPLSIMKNAYSMVCDGSLTAEKGVEYWGSGLKRILQVVEEFWTVLELEGEVKLNIQKNSIILAIKNAVEDSKKVIATNKKSLEIIINEPDFKIPFVLCDIKRINNVIYNLIDNAISYTQKGMISISYQMVENNKYLKVNIKDTGVGFTKEDKEKIGQKFYRAKNALLSHPDGSGIGLYISKSIIENNKGKLFYESEGENKGSVFSFILPVAD
ncbi:MAG: HAMP domain-containing sensor histidine kinase [Patescibacteria group bacterium]